MGNITLYIISVSLFAFTHISLLLPVLFCRCFFWPRCVHTLYIGRTFVAAYTGDSRGTAKTESDEFKRIKKQVNNTFLSIFKTLDMSVQKCRVTSVQQNFTSQIDSRNEGVLDKSQEKKLVMRWCACCQ